LIQAAGLSGDPGLQNESIWRDRSATPCPFHCLEAKGVHGLSLLATEMWDDVMKQLISLA
jgi:hypothetical protein